MLLLPKIYGKDGALTNADDMAVKLKNIRYY